MTCSKSNNNKAPEQSVHSLSFLIFNQGFFRYTCLLASPDLSLLKSTQRGTSLVVQWLTLLASTAGGVGSIPGQICFLHATCGTAKKLKKRMKKHVERCTQVLVSKEQALWPKWVESLK